MFKLTNGVNNVQVQWYRKNLKDKINFFDKEMQFASKYNNQDLEEVINSIINNSTIGVIVLSENYQLVEGYKRIIAINSFIDGKMTCNGKYYIELSDEEKNIFDNYQLQIFVGSRIS